MRRTEWEKGEFTVEASIVFVVSFMALIVFFYIGMVMYQHVHFQSVTDRVASRGAVMYAMRTTDMTGGQQIRDYSNSDPYRYFLDFGSNYKSRAEGAIQSALTDEIGKGNVLSDGGNSTPQAKVYLSLFSRRVEVTGHREYNIPFISNFNLENSLFDLDVRSTAYIIDMPETIRNVDIAVDVLRQFKWANTAFNKLGEFKGKALEFIGNFK